MTGIFVPIADPCCRRPQSRAMEPRFACAPSSQLPRLYVAPHIKMRLACWNIIYQVSTATLATTSHESATSGHRTLNERSLGGHHGFKHERRCASPKSIRRIPLDPAHHRPHLHGDDGQSPIWLDLLRRPDGQG